MSPLEHLRAIQHEDTVLPADSALEAFLGEISIRRVRRDLVPSTVIERRHLARTRRTA